MGYDQYTVPDTVAVKNTFLASPLVLQTYVLYMASSLKNSELRTTPNTFQYCCVLFFRPVTRTRKGNEQQFELAGNSCHRGKFQINSRIRDNSEFELQRFCICRQSTLSQMDSAGTCGTKGTSQRCPHRVKKQDPRKTGLFRGGHWGVPNTAIPYEKLANTEIPCQKWTKYRYRIYDL